MPSLDRYFERIGFKDPPRVNLETLTALHRLHLHTIPYENLDSQLGVPPTLDEAAAFEKLVLRRRGGWCYEMNGLFRWALEEIGFRSTRLSAGGMRETRGDGMLGNHLALIVHLDDDDYLCDVGFAEGQREPMRLRTGAHLQPPFVFELTRADNDYWRFHNHSLAAVRSFDFQTRAADQAALARMAVWLSAAPESPFVNNALCFIHDGEGISILRDHTVKRIDRNGAGERLIEGIDEYRETLADLFGLTLPQEQLAILWSKITTRAAVKLSTASAEP